MMENLYDHARGIAMELELFLHRLDDHLRGLEAPAPTPLELTEAAAGGSSSVAIAEESPLIASESSAEAKPPANTARRPAEVTPGPSNEAPTSSSDLGVMLGGG